MISKLTVYQQALHMAQLSDLAYNDNQLFTDFGYDSIFLSKNGTQAYFLWDKHNAIVVCRGTQPSEWADIKADLTLNLVPSNSGHGLVHHGFKQSVDLIWPDLVTLLKKFGSNRRIWCTGHSLGAAMATLITSRCHQLTHLPNPALFTFGSPKVGNAEYVEFMNSLNIEHHRWVNNADIVTRNPCGPYIHHGELNYMDHNGDVAVMGWLRLLIDRIKGFIVGVKKGKINYFVNHFITNYIKNLKEIVK